MGPWSQSAPGRRYPVSSAAAPQSPDWTSESLDMCCPIPVKRGVRQSRRITCYELICVLIISSCVAHMSTWTEPGSLGHVKGYLTCLKNSLCHSAWRERISPLKWRDRPPQVHLSQGGGFVRIFYEEGWRQCGSALSAWLHNFSRTGNHGFMECKYCKMRDISQQGGPRR